MPKFRYTAIDTAGKRSSGVLEAANAAAIADRLHRQSHLLLRADEVGQARSSLGTASCRDHNSAQPDEGRGRAVYPRAVRDASGRPGYRSRAALSRRDEREQARAAPSSGVARPGAGRQVLGVRLGRTSGRVFASLRQPGARRRGRRQARRVVGAPCRSPGARATPCRNHSVGAHLSHSSCRRIDRHDRSLADLRSAAIHADFRASGRSIADRNAHSHRHRRDRARSMDGWILVGLLCVGARGLSGIASARHTPCRRRRFASPADRGPSDPTEFRPHASPGRSEHCCAMASDLSLRSASAGTCWEI